MRFFIPDSSLTTIEITSCSRVNKVGCLLQPYSAVFPCLLTPTLPICPPIAQTREGLTARYPPSITNSCPFMYPAAGDARYTAVPAISSALYTTIRQMSGIESLLKGAWNRPTYVPGRLAGTETTGIPTASVAS